METYWSRGNAPTLFLAVYILHRSEHCWIREGYITGLAKPQGAGQKKRGRKEKEKRASGHLSCASFCLSVCQLWENTYIFFEEYFFIWSFKGVWRWSLGSGFATTATDGPKPRLTASQNNRKRSDYRRPPCSEWILKLFWSIGCTFPPSQKDNM